MDANICLTETVQTNRKRIPYFDVMKGILMLTVVFDHIILFDVNTQNPYEYFLSCMFQSFNMPLFFMIAGFMLAFSGKKFLTIKQTFQHIKKRFIQCIIPFFMWPIVRHIMFEFPKDMSIHNMIMSVPNVLISPQTGLWFLLCLFVADTLLSILILIYNKTQKAILFWILVITIEMALIVVKPYNIVGLYNVYYFLPFFVFGFCINKYSLVKFLQNNLVFLILLCGFLFIIPYYNRINTPLFLRLILGICGSLSLWRICMSLFQDGFALKFFTHFGEKSMAIYCVHGIFVSYSLIDLPMFQWDFLNFVLVTLASIAVSYACIWCSNIISLSPVLNLLLNGQQTSKNK